MPIPDTWSVLVADDDFDMLAVTELALMGLTVEGRPVECVCVPSFAEAQVAMERQRFAVAIIDVVMETDDAGLRLVEWIREQIDFRPTRIIVRTGQPGRAPEQKLLAEYDINDYWPKTQVGAKRGRTIVAGLIRSHRDLLLVEEQRRELADRERELVLARDAAERASASKTTFLASVNHELRTPLSAILGLSELALEASKDPEVIDLLSSLHLNARALHGLVSDVLDLSRIEAGALAVIHKPMRLRRIVEDVCDLHAALAARRELVVECRVDADLPTWSRGDPDRIQQLLMNLVGNAIKYTSAGHVRVEARLIDVLDNQGTRIELRVADTGRGIPPQELEALRGRLLEGKATPIRSGSRLGLGIASRLMGHLGGEWSTLDSVYGQGSTFAVQLDLQVVGEPPTPVVPVDLAGRRVRVEVGAERLRADVVEVLVRAGVTLVDDPDALVVTDDPGRQGAIALVSPGRGRQGVALPLNASRLWGAIHAWHATGPVQPSRRPQLPSLRILVVDDDPTNLQVMETRLTRAGMTVVTAETGEDAVEHYIPGRFDLVLMDIVLPGISGWEAARRIRGKERSFAGVEPARIVGVSAHATKESQKRSVDEGFHDWLPKPVTTERLHAIFAACEQPSAQVPRVLLVEDSPVLRMLFVQYLKAVGVREVTEAEDGERGVELGHDADIIMMDVDLPGIDGLETTRRLRAQGCDAHIHVVSAFDDPDLDKRALHVGADGVLRKPVGRTDLLALVERWRSRRSPRGRA